MSGKKAIEGEKINLRFSLKSIKLIMKQILEKKTCSY